MAKQDTQSGREQLAKAKKVVIKVGTSTITHENGRFNLNNLEHLCRSIANQMNQGKEIILVSSGAIGVGVGRLHLKQKPKVMREKQAVAAVGQCELMNMYSRLLSDYHYVVAQILLTKDDIDDPVTRENICNTFQALLEREILPIVNENDTVSTREIYHNGTFGDNDMLSAIVARLVGADLLIILSDIDGLYDKDPHEHADAALISTVAKIDDTIEAAAGGEGSNRGTGGMRTKLNAARIANEAGIDAVIANGSVSRIVDDVLEGRERGTLFLAGSGA
ncbi:MAG: glutamate 5-kinase [Clostridiaceae bacterium]|nr:glutamate 5-kinase [Eubacteriales bacterium]MDD4140659.1 glutamate 5-kinase [Eubacteriales bacterium]MDD4744668.1 glutamate 5-kinase [Eubacteriales bacterium]NLB44276.1 glutamate 5-kinase [Clostridiaceae bacterium]